MHLVGQTGEGKTELAALQLQHFGPRMDARRLPGSWSSTGNALEMLAFAAKDTLVVVDDFAPSGTRFDVQGQHREAARLIRGKGNQAGRGRLGSDGTLRPAKPPRGLILSTGEDVPTGHSVRARMLVLELPAGEMNWKWLTTCQRKARQGLYSQAMVGFIQWLAPRYEEIRKRKGRRTAKLRSAATARSQHRRTPSIVAELAFGMELFLSYARDSGALDEAEVKRLWERTWTALGKAAELQSEHLASANPVDRFLELLRSAIVAGEAHVASNKGEEPDKPQVWGWRQKTIGAGDSERTEWQPQGDRIGWLKKKRKGQKENDLYLDPDAAYRVAQRMAIQDGLTVTPQTLWKRLEEAGILATTDKKRQRNTVRATLQGTRREVLHLHRKTLQPRKPSQPSQPSQEGDKAAVPSMDSWDGFDVQEPEPSHEAVPDEALGSALPPSDGPVGAASQNVNPITEESWEEV
jgi:hypothetical protein